MFPEKTQQDIENEAAWSGLYWTAALGVLIALALMLLDIALSFAGADPAVGRLTAVDWYAHLQESWLIGLRNLGLFNVINSILTIPLYLALYRLNRRGSPVLAALALTLFLLGAAVYAANNRALVMLSLSSQYAAAASEAQKALLATAGTVILAQAEDFTPGTFLGFFLSSTGSLLMMAALLRAGVLRRWDSLAGLVGTGCLLIFSIGATFVPAAFDLLMLLAMIGGLLMVAWNIRMVLAMAALGKMLSKKAAGPVAPGFAARNSEAAQP